MPVSSAAHLIQIRRTESLSYNSPQPGVRLGREQVWKLEPRRLLDARQTLELISQQWDQKLERLRRLVEG